jgi:hypothetical protein
MEENVEPMKRAPKVVFTEGNIDMGTLSMVDDQGERQSSSALDGEKYKKDSKRKEKKKRAGSGKER